MSLYSRIDVQFLSFGIKVKSDLVLFQIAENERLQELSMMPSGEQGGQEYNAFQQYLARNMLQLNMMETAVPSYDPLSPDKKSHLQLH